MIDRFKRGLAISAVDAVVSHVYSLAAMVLELHNKIISTEETNHVSISFIRTRKVGTYAMQLTVDPLETRGNYSATSNNNWAEHLTGRGCSPPRPLFAVPIVTAHPSTASVLITVLLYNGPLLCGFNVGIKGLN